MKNIALHLSPELSTKIREFADKPGVTQKAILEEMTARIEIMDLDAWAKGVMLKHVQEKTGLKLQEVE